LKKIALSKKVIEIFFIDLQQLLKAVSNVPMNLDSIHMKHHAINTGSVTTMRLN
jgi:hypothetical protein